mgnify:CR=1 FL=1
MTSKLMWFDFNHILSGLNGDEICRLLISIFVVRCGCDRTVFLTTVDGSGFCVDVRHGIVKSWTASRNHIVSSEPASLQAIGAYFSSIVSLNGVNIHSVWKSIKKVSSFYNNQLNSAVFSLFARNSAEFSLFLLAKKQAKIILCDHFSWFLPTVLPLLIKSCAITWTFVERSCAISFAQQSFWISR